MKEMLSEVRCLKSNEDNYDPRNCLNEDMNDMKI